MAENKTGKGAVSARVPMAPEETICSFMEPRPQQDAPLSLTYRGAIFSPAEFWTAGEYETKWRPTLEACPDVEKLGRLREVEERLTEEQWAHYLRWLMYDSDSPCWSRTVSYGSVKTATHATAEQKIKALASVLKGGPNA